jgi:hypothetical protein
MVHNGRTYIMDIDRKLSEIIIEDSALEIEECFNVKEKVNVLQILREGEIAIVNRKMTRLIIYSKNLKEEE